jgi:phosphoribosylamine--glycine ligase
MEGCQNLPLSVDDFEGIERFALVHGVSLVIVGPELPLSLGITDYLQKRGVPVFGPNQVAAQIESSKAWAKAFMKEAGIPTAASAVFSANEPEDAKTYVRNTGAPIVVKADGLAAGKGVTVAETVEQACEAIDTICQGKFGKAGDRIVVEEYLRGQEVSVLALTDGKTVRALMPSQDHKPIGEGDTGPNTGGMGAYAPTPVVTPELSDRIEREILQPAIATLQQRGIDYRGVLYAGLMIGESGDPKVLEFNCRFGDPETQAILPLLETPLIDLLQACTEGRLKDLPPILWQSGASVCVVLASAGYPGSYQKGRVISGIEAAESEGAIVFHAGTQLKQQQLLASGGRVLGVSATGDTLQTAVDNTYRAVDRIQFEGCYFRKDIAYRALS